ncbi:MAG: glycosyltransferase family 2 protein, partial [Bacteroidales bacterium]|nr:glycosyltransferase family 2 protein [Bacteroidales bacterium]
MIKYSTYPLPLVSVCIPTYNASATILDTLSCVINQTYTNLEIIICDNCSNDDTVSLIENVSDHRIKLSVNPENFGMVGNFNIVLSKTSGKYVKLLCADDIISPDCIEKQVKVFLENPDQHIVMVAAEKHVINQKGDFLFRKKFPGKTGIYPGMQALRKSFRYGTNIFGEPGAILFLNKAIQKAGDIQISPHLTYVVDLQLYAQVLKQGNLFVLKEFLFSFRLTSTSYSAHSKWKPAIVFNQLRKKYSKENFIKFSLFDKLSA